MNQQNLKSDFPIVTICGVLMMSDLQRCFLPITSDLTPPLLRNPLRLKQKSPVKTHTHTHISVTLPKTNIAMENPPF